MREVMTESARAAADAVNAAAAATASGLRSAARTSLKLGEAAARGCWDRVAGDPTEEEVLERAYEAAEKRGGNTDAEDIKEQGNKLYKGGYYLEALSRYKQAMEMDPKAASYVGNYAATLGMLGRKREAADACLTAAALDSSFVRARQRLGALAATPDGLEHALQAAIAAAKARPNKCVALRRQAWAAQLLTLASCCCAPQQRGGQHPRAGALAPLLHWWQTHALTQHTLSQQLTFAARARADGGALFARGQYAAADAAFSDGLEKAELVNGIGMPLPPGAALLHCNRSMARCAQARYREALTGALRLLGSSDVADVN